GSSSKPQNLELPVFTNRLSEGVFKDRYAHAPNCLTWKGLARTVATDVCGGLLRPEAVAYIRWMIETKRFIPGGRYLYYAGRRRRFWNNCALLRCEEDTREDWADLAQKATSCLMTGMGIGADYSVYRGRNTTLMSTGGVSSGPIPAMEMVNEIGRRVRQGGTRR